MLPQHARALSSVPQQGIEPTLLAVEAQSLNHWTAPSTSFLPLCPQPHLSSSLYHLWLFEIWPLYSRSSCSSTHPVPLHPADRMTFQKCKMTHAPPLGWILQWLLIALKSKLSSLALKATSDLGPAPHTCHPVPLPPPLCIRLSTVSPWSSALVMLRASTPPLPQRLAWSLPFKPLPWLFPLALSF